MGNTVKVGVELEDSHLDLLKQIDPTDRLLGLKHALKAAGTIVVKRAQDLCPKPGYPGDDPTKKPLRDSIGMEVRVYDHAIVIVIGPEYPAGAHGHLIEFGHYHVMFGVVTGDFLPAQPFMRPAADETKSEQDAAITSVLESRIAKAG
jgi:hypothetical protein